MMALLPGIEPGDYRGTFFRGDSVKERETEKPVGVDFLLFFHLVFSPIKKAVRGIAPSKLPSLIPCQAINYLPFKFIFICSFGTLQEITCLTFTIHPFEI
jgi:hypothetical protein